MAVLSYDQSVIEGGGGGKEKPQTEEE